MKQNKVPWEGWENRENVNNSRRANLLSLAYLATSTLCRYSVMHLNSNLNFYIEVKAILHNKPLTKQGSVSLEKNINIYIT